MGDNLAEHFFGYRKVGNVDLYKGREWLSGHDHCPYCRALLSGGMGWNDRDWLRSLMKVSTCPSCGWWFAVQDADNCNDGFAVVAVGVMERFDLDSASVPLEVLHEQLARTPSRIAGIHARKMEDLVRSILAGVYDCEVHHLGYSRDGGIDLLLLHSDKEVAVQVRRRESPKKREPVSAIREFLGASLLEGHNQLMYVTSAERFTAGARRAAEKAVANNLVDSYELISGDKLSALLRQTKPSVWREAMKVAIERGDAPNVPNPYDYCVTRRAE